MPTPQSAVRNRADAAVVTAVDEARAAAVDAGGAGAVGEHQGHRVEGDRVVSHLFASTQRGYRGWQWSVTVGRASRQRTVTVNEVVLIPGPTRSWPRRGCPGPNGWSRVTSGLVTCSRSRTTTRGWFPAGSRVTRRPSRSRDDRSVRAVVDEVGLGRERVLSLEGRDAAAERWYDSDRGPAAAVAEGAPGRCVSCGFLLRLGGPLGLLFGVCANGNVADDGGVVALDHGCGGHSDVRMPAARTEQRLPEPVVDTVAYAPLSWD